ncbi:MAG: GIY-YIG nuclease family protein [Bacteroidetes bacterium]|nr:GIY-YIG nuclease family protein [Bacteroidota bacterium]
MHFHNIFETGFTARYRPWKIIFKKECASRKEALELEKKIKKWKSKIMIHFYNFLPSNRRVVSRKHSGLLAELNISPNNNLGLFIFGSESDKYFFLNSKFFLLMVFAFFNNLAYVVQRICNKLHLI